MKRRRQVGTDGRGLRTSRVGPGAIFAGSGEPRLPGTLRPEEQLQPMMSRHTLQPESRVGVQPPARVTEHEHTQPTVPL